MADFRDIILRELDTMRKADLAEKRIHPARAYQKVMNGIKDMDTPIRSVDDVEGLPGIGAKIKEKIKEIVETGSLASAARARERVELDVHDILKGVHGIGPVKAKELIETHGIKSIEQLRKEVAKNPGLLNEIQKMGLKYYEDSQLRIPREEMSGLESLLLTAFPDEFRAEIVGSYRRGAGDSGDIDVLLTISDTFSEEQKESMFRNVIYLLRQDGYIVDTLAEGPRKFMGYIRLDPGNAKGHVRRLDMLITPESEFPYAILYFTGSQDFNVAFRKHALEKGYSLNEHTMKPIVAGVKAPEEGEIRTERDIFDFLGLEYIAPTERKDKKSVRPVKVGGGRARSKSREKKRRSKKDEV